MLSPNWFDSSGSALTVIVITRKNEIAPAGGNMNTSRLRTPEMALLFTILVLAACTALAQESKPTGSDPSSSPGTQDLTRLSLEDLMNVEVTSVARQRQKIADAPAAVYVIGQEDIRRSGMTSIPELLRLAPGLDVGRINANQWAISARGFNTPYASHLLVLQDGRTLYNPLFSGVFWDVQDYILQDLQQIEVVRGPGATLWGSNAVNGVINITSKSARDTQGGLVDMRTSTEEDLAAVRYGGRIDENTWYRVYAKYRSIDDMDFATGGNAEDGSDDFRSGFRIDRQATEQDTLTLQGDLYNMGSGRNMHMPSALPPLDSVQNSRGNNSGGNILGRWQHVTSDKSDFALQLYYDRTDRGGDDLQYGQDTFDIDFQHRFALDGRQQIIWGAGFCFLSDSTDDTTLISFDPHSRDTYVASAFVQDNISLVPDRLHLFLGSKFEQNSYTGFEIQPSARLLWTPDAQNSVWAAVSRAVRTPNRFEEDARVTLAKVSTGTGPSASVDMFGNQDLRSEKLMAYELGYRVQPGKRWSVDLAGFYNDYDDLHGSNGGAMYISGSPPQLVIPVYRNNGVSAETWGAEISTTAVVTDSWRVAASYTWLQVQAHSKDGVTPTQETDRENQSPHNQFQLRSYFDITRNLEFNAALFYVDNLSALDVPAYTRLDVGLTWRPVKNLDLSAGVQNLLDNRHNEYSGGSQGQITDEIGRNVWAEMVWRF